MEHAIDTSLQYMSERQAFGRPINKFQVLRHRVAVTYKAEAREIRSDDIVQDILNTVPVP